MKNNRFHALQQAQNREEVLVELPSVKVSDYFASMVFHDEVMQNYMPSDVYKSIKNAIKNGTKLDRSIADQVASSMKTWAAEKGANSYTHWFQPLTGATAEKHDSFFMPTQNFKSIEIFGGDALVQQEPDASSFPNGGIRQTFEARGYTAWDPSSPAFIIGRGNGKTLCIPTIFISYTGEALDFKAPLLKSMAYLEQAALPVVNMFDRHATKVVATLGWEQEYFLIDEALFYARPDLVLSGRTLIGHAPAKGQQLDDHYFGTIPDRVYQYMLDLEQECHQLGIPIRTRHNEVAPGQFELAPMFEEVNVAVDHNQLLMDVMDRVAKRHKLKVLLHEKPFAGVNGSGKHNNWSMSTDTGKNLLSPGKTPRTNLLFLTFFVNVIKAVHENADLLRACIASAGNDHRLGANEAPPAIISVFIGDHLQKVLDEVVSKVKSGKLNTEKSDELKLNIHNGIPDVMLDNTDRNRTSPFAFTGNKFEFRAVGSSANCSLPMMILNTIMANQLTEFKILVDKHIKSGDDKEGAVLKVLKTYIESSRNIVFEGDNYSAEWAKEAAKRGLSNVKTTPHALDFFISKKAKETIVKTGILNERELEARYEIFHENYVKKVQIEGRLIGELALDYVIPSAIEYQNKLIQNVTGLKGIGAKATSYKTQMTIIDTISEHISAIYTNTEKMIEARKKANTIHHMPDKSKAYCDKVIPNFELIRKHCDKLEQLVDDESWKLPKYRELLFTK
jgi:glutamine synthetase